MNIYKQLSQKDPETYLPKSALLLNDLGILLDDLKILEKEGITHPDVEKIRKLLKE